MRREIFTQKDLPSQENTFKEKIISYFPPESLSNFPESTIEYLVSAETIFQHLIEWEKIDGTAIILEYQKAIDAMLELYITSAFRKFCHSSLWNNTGIWNTWDSYTDRNNLKSKNISTPLEKSLSLVLHKKYSLSLWRLYEILKNINEKKSLWKYEAVFYSFLKSKTSLDKALLETDFFLQLQELVKLWLFTEKRHSGIISLSESIKARKLITGWYSDTNSLLYILASTQMV